MSSSAKAHLLRFTVGTATVAILASTFAPGPAVATPAQESASPAVDTRAFTPTLAYVDCPRSEKRPPRTQCAELTVPLDWQTPDDGRTVDIAVRITRAKDNPGSNGLTWNPGGPGGSGVAPHAGFYSLLPASIQTAFDWVSWDPRGVGLSEPKLTGCESDGAGIPLTGPVDWDEYWTVQEQTAGAAAAACFAANPNAAPYLGTWQVVRDLDALRSTLKYDRWNYWGMSYGTRIGNTYARTFPDKLRAFIQDGPIMANETIARFGSTTPPGDNLAIQVYASVMGKMQASKIRVILSFLDNWPGADAEFNRFGFLGSINDALRSQGNYAAVKSDVDAIYKAIVSSPSEIEQRVRPAVRRLDRLAPDPASDAFLTDFVNCADMDDRPTPVELGRMSRVAEQNYGTAYGLSVVRASSCLGIPSGFSPTSKNGDSSLALKNPPLVLLTSGDAGTPWAWGRSLANTYTGSKTVTYNSTQHVSFFITPSTCVADAAVRYLLALELPRTDIYCRFVKSPAPSG